jgi:hypothetical protein
MSAEERTGPEQLVEGWNQLFRALAAEPRRQIVGSLIEAPAERHLELPQAANPPFDRRDPAALSVQLRHVHLPRLAEGGYVRWEGDPLSVWQGPTFEEVAAVFRALYDHAEELPNRLVNNCRRLEKHRSRGD